MGEFYRPFRVSGHVACRLCEADGRGECARLYGLGSINPAAAFHFAAERLEREVIIDASKDLAWCEQFLARGDLRPHFIHLVRHPCGYMESERRRDAAKSWQRLFSEWRTRELRIEKFIAKHPDVPSISAVYDDLADDPIRRVPEVCAFLGYPFEAPALRYWEFEHHGLGANGAASLYLRNRKVRNFDTGDDAFYARCAEFAAGADRRWTSVIPLSVRDRCLAHAYVRRLKRQLSPSSIWAG